jgi:hypothetical protein
MRKSGDIFSTSHGLNGAEELEIFFKLTKQSSKERQRAGRSDRDRDIGDVIVANPMVLVS